MTEVIKKFDWNNCGRRTQSQPDAEPPREQLLFNGCVNKLHGELEHESRKTNFNDFEKTTNGIMICTDVASRGLDFKKVDWIVQYDLTSSVKEYVNRIGRTARIASKGSAMCFVMPQETEYITHYQKHFKIKLTAKNRFGILRDFEKLF